MDKPKLVTKALSSLGIKFHNKVEELKQTEDKGYFRWVVTESYDHGEDVRTTTPTVCKLADVCKHMQNTVRDSGLLQRRSQLHFTHQRSLLDWLAEVGELGRNHVSSIYFDWAEGLHSPPDAAEWTHVINLLRACHNLRSLVVDISHMTEWFMNLELDGSKMKQRLGSVLHKLRGLSAFAIKFDEDKFSMVEYECTAQSRVLGFQLGSVLSTIVTTSIRSCRRRSLSG